MSEKAKDRLVAVGTRFTTLEHENQATRPRDAKSQPSPSLLSQSSPSKMQFWKKAQGQAKAVYGAQHPPLLSNDGALLDSISKSSKLRNKKQLSFQEFQGSTVDAWEECDDDMIKISSSPLSSDLQAHNVSETDSSKPMASLDAETKLREINICDNAEIRADVKVSEEHEMKERQPKAAKNEAKHLKNSVKVKQAIVSKLSETIAKATKGKLSPPPPVSHDNPGIMQAPRPQSPIRQMKSELQDQENIRLEKFGKLLAGPTTDLDQFRKLCWNGIPTTLRPSAWRLLSGYLPPSIDRRQSTLERKREEYYNFVSQYYPTRFDELNQETFRQIHIDIPRTNPLIPIFQQEVVQELFERILYIWAIRHPASGYVQGINDLVVPFFVMFLSEHIENEVETHDINTIAKDTLDSVEADTFWCLTRLLDGIQDNYTFAQPGIQMKVNALSELVKRIDAPMHSHIVGSNIDFLQFTFRWMNNLLMRELPLRCVIRLWDTYWSEPDGFAIFHLYVCAALLTGFSKEISRKCDFQSLMTYLQNLPTRSWTEEDVAIIVAEAYRLKFIFADAPKHLKSNAAFR
eukprot:gene6150-6856_t